MLAAKVDQTTGLDTAAWQTSNQGSDGFLKRQSECHDWKSN